MTGPSDGLVVLARWTLSIFVVTLLNLMDAVTYGRLVFPIQDPFFAEFGMGGICLYMLSTMVSQLVITLLSSFKHGVTASMMVENLPFFHTICFQVLRASAKDRAVVIPTILTAFAISTLLTSLAFFLLATLDCERIVHQFPRYVLVGAMGGIGAFLIITGLEIVLGQTLSWTTAGGLLNSDKLFLWLLGGTIAAAVLTAEYRYKVSFLAPVTSAGILIVFYIIVPLLPFSLSSLRKTGWLVDAPTKLGWPLEIYGMLDFHSTDWRTILSITPTLFGLAFFGLLHVPINVPSYARSCGQMFRMRTELIAHGVSNLVAAGIGLLPNYFVYTNSVLFLRSGAKGRCIGVVLAGTTAFMLFAGLPVLAFVPTTIMLFLIFYLGLDLMREAVVSSIRYADMKEYAIIWVVIISMLTLGFVKGIIAGLALAAANVAFELLRLHLRPVEISGEEDIATTKVIYSPSEAAFLRAVRPLVAQVSFPGFLYFGNFIAFVNQARRVFESVEYVIFDCSDNCFYDMNVIEGILALLTDSQCQRRFTVFVRAKGPLKLALRDTKLFSNGRLLLFDSHSAAMVWCEKRLLDTLGLANDTTESHAPTERSSLLEIETGWHVSVGREAAAQILAAEEELVEGIRPLGTISAEGIAYREYPDEECIYAGEPIDEVWILTSGNVRIRTAGSMVEQFRCINIISLNDLAGPIEAIAAGHTKLLRLTPQAISEYIFQYPQDAAREVGAKLWEHFTQSIANIG